MIKGTNRKLTQRELGSIIDLSRISLTRPVGSGGGGGSSRVLEEKRKKWVGGGRRNVS